MKQVIMSVVIYVVMFQVKSQSITQVVIKSYPGLAITNTKTTSLVFPKDIRYVDRGTNEILTQQVKGANNILLLKAAKVHFKETNLSVLTIDGKLYSFKVEYDSLPQGWVYYFKNDDRDSVSPNLGVLKGSSLDDIAKLSNELLFKKRKVYGVACKKWQTLLMVKGVYIKTNSLFFQLTIKNTSHIDYDIDFIKVYIRDLRKNKRTSSQELEVHPLFIAGDTSRIKAQGKNDIVIALEKFTTQEAKYLAIEVHEKNGGRHLLVKLGNYRITKAILLP
jgi:conjugative transposon TraN protein